MNWFKNLNATPRLMSSFGVMIVLALGIGYLGISSLSNANERVGLLYQQDMRGAIMANDITIDRLALGRECRDAILHIDDPAAVAVDEKNMLSYFVKMHSSLEGADKTFYSKEGVAALTAIHQTLPAYEKGYHDLYQRIDAKDLAGANAALVEVNNVGKPLYDGADQARAVKEAAAEERFQANIQAYQTTRSLMIGVCGICLAVGLIMSFVIARGFSVPLGQAVEALEKVAGGDLTAYLDVETKDEVGRMATALNTAVERLNSTMREVADSASNASSSSQQLAAASESIASGAQEQAASLEETSASLEEITATVRQSADNAQQASQLATSSKDSALQGQEVVTKAITAMEEINVASAKISDIISTIDEIAFQTNLLAVNAAVEAARAGDEGRGFAVVASEVRSLAQRSAVAAKEIKVLIQDSLRKVDAGSVLVNRSGETLQGIVGSVKRVTDIVTEIAAASNEQSAGIEQVNSAMTQMDQVTQGNSAQTEELSATAEALSEQAAHLLELVGTFTLTQGEYGQRDRQSAQSHAANSAHPILQSSTAAHLNIGARPSAKIVRSVSTSKSDSNGRGSKRLKSKQPTLAAAVPSGSISNDASFQEF